MNIFLMNINMKKSININSPLTALDVISARTSQFAAGGPIGFAFRSKGAAWTIEKSVGSTHRHFRPRK
jgi:hypothetical protein